MRPIVYTTLAIALAAPAAHAVSVTVTDCAAPPVAKVGKRTVIDRPADDVTVQCALLPLAGTQRVEVIARSIVVDGDAGGSVASGGKGPAIALTALGTDANGTSIRVTGANVTAANPNGNVDLDGPGAIALRDSQLQAGGDLRVACTGAACPITLDDVSTTANDVSIVAEGPVTITTSAVRTASPIDLMEIVSRTADVLLADAAAFARGVSRLACRDDVLRLCPGPDCPLPVIIQTVQDAIDFCECPNAEPTVLETGIEGVIRITAPNGDVDLRGATVAAGENVEITALGTARLDGARVANCGPKSGSVTVTATDCTIADAVLLDDEPDPQPTLACAASGTPAELGTCSARP